MATVQEARQQIEQARVQLEQQRQQTQQARPQELTRQQLIKQTPQIAAQRQTQQAEFEKQKQLSMQGLQQYEQELKQYEQQVKSAEAQQATIDQEARDWAVAEKYARRGKIPIGETASVRNKWQDIREYGYKIISVEEIPVSVGGINFYQGGYVTADQPFGQDPIPIARVPVSILDVVPTGAITSSGKVIITEPAAIEPITVLSEPYYVSKAPDKMGFLTQLELGKKEIDFRLQEKMRGGEPPKFTSEIKTISTAGLKEGQTYYYDPQTRGFAKALPYAATPFFRSRDFYKVEDGKLVRTQPKTIVGGVSNLFWGTVEKIDPGVRKGISWFKTTKQWEKVTPQEKALFTAEVQVTPGLYDVPGQLVLWSGFSPFMKTATYQEGGLEELGKEAKKGKFEELKKAFVSKTEKELIKKKSALEQTKYLNELAKNVNRNDPQAVRGFQELVKNLYERGIYKGVPLEAVGTQDVVHVQFYFKNIPQLQKVETLGGLSSAFRGDMEMQPEKFRETIFTTQSTINLGKMKETPFISETAGTATVLGMNIQERETQALSPLLKSFSKQAPTSQTKSAQGMGAANILGAKSVQQEKQILKEQAVQRTGLRQRQAMRQLQKPQLKFPKPIPPGGVGGVDKRLLKNAIEKVSRGGYKVLGRRKGKFSEISPTLTKGEAIVFGRKWAKETLGTTFKLVPSKEPIKRLGLGKPKGIDTEFKEKAPLEFVQKRGYRLSTRGEVKEIQIAKKKGGKKKKWL